MGGRGRGGPGGRRGGGFVGEEGVLARRADGSFEVPEGAHPLIATVVDPEGRPVPGAKVTLWGLMTENHKRLPFRNNPLITKAGPDGRFGLLPCLDLWEKDPSAEGKLRNVSIPGSVEYDVRIDPPAGVALARYQGRIPWSEDARIELEPATFHTFAFEGVTGNLMPLQNLRGSLFYYGLPKEDSGSFHLDDAEMREGAWLPDCTVHASIIDCAGVCEGVRPPIYYAPLRVTADSPRGLVLKPRPAVEFRGKIRHGLTDEAVAGAFVVESEASLDLSKITSEQWKALEALSLQPKPSDPALRAIGEHWQKGATVARADSEGCFCLRSKPGRNATLVVFGQGFVSVIAKMDRLDCLGSEEVSVPDIFLFPSAEVRLRIVGEEALPDPVDVYWWVRPEDNPGRKGERWDAFNKVCYMARSFFVSDDGVFHLFPPAGVHVTIELRGPVPKIKLAPPVRLEEGEIRDLGEVAIPQPQGVSPPEDGILARGADGSFEVPEGAQPLIATVVDPEGWPVAGATVTLLDLMAHNQKHLPFRNQPIVTKTGPDGRFGLLPYLDSPEKDAGGEKSPKNMGIPRWAEYDIQIDPPPGVTLAQYRARVLPRENACIELEPATSHTFVFEDVIGEPVPPQHLGRCEPYYRLLEEPEDFVLFYLGDVEMREGAWLPACTVHARIRDWGRTSEDIPWYIYFAPLRVTADSPRELVLKPRPSVGFRGRILHGLTDEPVAGAFVVESQGSLELSKITSEQWKALEQLPLQPRPSDPPLRAIGEHWHKGATVARTNSEGCFYLRSKPGRDAALVVFAQGFVCAAVRMDRLDCPSSEEVSVPDIFLFPSAEARLRFVGKEAISGHIHVPWRVRPEDNPGRIGERWHALDQVCSMRPQAFRSDDGVFHIFPPAGVYLGIKLLSPPPPIELARMVRLEEGEVLDLGEVPVAQPQEASPAGGGS